MSEDRDPVLRASDADRDAVADRLRVAHTEGRLSVEEYGERLDAAFAARTLGDLALLTADLPPPDRAPARTGDEPTPGRSTAPARRERRGGAALQAAWGTWLVAVLVNVVIWAIVSLSQQDWVYFWPAWVGGPWGAVLLAGTLSGRFSRPPGR